MIGLIAFLSRLRHVLLLLLLEGVALYWAATTNDPQRKRTGDLLLEMSLEVHSWKKEVTGYFGLSEVNRQLKAENIELRENLVALSMELARLKNDSSIHQLDYSQIIPEDQPKDFKFIPARVLRNTTARAYNYITLDKGSDDGVLPDMGVVSPQGVVGRVVLVKSDYSLVLSALNLAFRLPVKAKAPGAGTIAGDVGYYEWDRRSIRYATLSYVPETVPLETGYIVLTSGYSTIFPPGIKVGVVSEVSETSSDGFHQAKIQLATDFSKLGDVYLIQSLHKDSLDDMERNLPNE
ncbi:MAG: hypothetical protein OHK0039_24530 [Bacteroidia bacterium]